MRILSMFLISAFITGCYPTKKPMPTKARENERIKTIDGYPLLQGRGKELGIAAKKESDYIGAEADNANDRDFSAGIAVGDIVIIQYTIDGAVPEKVSGSRGVLKLKNVKVRGVSKPECDDKVDCPAAGLFNPNATRGSIAFKPTEAMIGEPGPSGFSLEASAALSFQVQAADSQAVIPNVSDTTGKKGLNAINVRILPRGASVAPTCDGIALGDPNPNSSQVSYVSTEATSESECLNAARAFTCQQVGPNAEFKKQVVAPYDSCEVTVLSLNVVDDVLNTQEPIIPVVLSTCGENNTCSDSPFDAVSQLVVGDGDKRLSFKSSSDCDTETKQGDITYSIENGRLKTVSTLADTDVHTSCSQSVTRFSESDKTVAATATSGTCEIASYTMTKSLQNIDESEFTGGYSSCTITQTAGYTSLTGSSTSPCQAQAATSQILTNPQQPTASFTSAYASCLNYATKPQTDKDDGKYHSILTVKLTGVSGETVHYTTNGQDPTCYSAEAPSAGIVINKDEMVVMGGPVVPTTIKAISCRLNFEPSPVATFTYSVNPITNASAKLFPNTSTCDSGNLTTCATWTPSVKFEIANSDSIGLYDTSESELKTPSMATSGLNKFTATATVSQDDQDIIIKDLSAKQGVTVRSGAASLPMSFNGSPFPGGAVNAMVQAPNGFIFAGTNSGLYRWNGTVWDNLSANLSGASYVNETGTVVSNFTGSRSMTSIKTLLLHNDTLYVGGDANGINANPALSETNVACSGSYTTTATTAGFVAVSNLYTTPSIKYLRGVGSSGVINTLALNDNKIYLGGSFSSANSFIKISFCSSPFGNSQTDFGVQVQNFSVFDTTTQTMSGPTTGPNASVYSIVARSASEVYVFGEFSTAGSCTTECRLLAKWNGTTWSSTGIVFNSGFPSRMAEGPSGDIYITTDGGNLNNITQCGSSITVNFIIWNPSTSQIKCDIPNKVFTLEAPMVILPSGDAYMRSLGNPYGVAFLRYNRASNTWTQPTGELLRTVTSNSYSANVMSMLIDLDGNLIVGGNINTADGKSRPSIVKYVPLFDRWF